MRKKIFSKHPLFVNKNNFNEAQLNSWEWFKEDGLKELFDEFSPIKDFANKDFTLWIDDYYFDAPLLTEREAKAKGISYEAPLRVKLKLENKKTGEIKQQEVFFGNFPQMSDRGTFLVNGVERVVVSQIIRSSGVFFSMRKSHGKNLFGAKIIPHRGAWLEFETENDQAIYVRIDRKRKIPATALLRIFGLEDDESIRKAFKNLTKNSEVDFIENTLKKDPSHNVGEAFIEIYKRLRPGDLATVDNAKSLIRTVFFDFSRYDLAPIGRYKFNLRLAGMSSQEARSKKTTKEERLLSQKDVIEVLSEIIRLNNDPDSKPDDIDNMSNRRIRTVGELIQNKMRVGLTRMERIIRDRMTISDPYTLVPAQLINARPLIAIVHEFFTSSQLAQFMDQVNPLAELEHKRRLSAMGPGGLTRERAGFEVRDVHPSHYGRICPIQTPEGPNIGLVGHLSTLARVNNFGFVETPYKKVSKGKVSDEIVYLTAGEEEKHVIAHGGVELTDKGYIKSDLVEARVHGEPSAVEKNKVDLIDISAQQSISVATSLIPFLEHDDANRALMGSNMQRQAISCVRPQAPLVATGSEEKAARDSGQVLLAEDEGEVMELDADHILVKYKKDPKHPKIYYLHTFTRSNQSTCISHKTRVMRGDKVRKGDVLADGASTQEGQLALGQNLTVAFLSFEGWNFEDAIILNEKVVRDDRFASIHIENFSVDVRDTKLGPEITTRDIPNVGEEKLKDLDESGVVRIGAEVGAGDILVGKISPKGEVDLTPEERLLRSIFGEKSRDVKDTSLRLPHGKRGRIIGIKIFSRDQGDALSPGVINSIQIEVAQFRNVMVGDKLAGRHGNKGVISKILPEEDMPYLADGTPVDMVLNPLGIISRMNIGQVLETHLGQAAKILGYQAITPSLDGASEKDIKTELRLADFPENGKVDLYDGRTGEKFMQKVTVGVIYFMKLNHLVEDKIHMRSIGGYSLITQQPLSGKAQFGGQRFGEMEVCALEGYGAAHVLQEMLTIKSDDVLGRTSAYDAIIRGEPITNINAPASFNVLVNELKALGMSVDLLGEKKPQISSDQEKDLNEIQ